MSFIRAPPNDTKAYHPNAPKRGASFVSKGDEVMPAPRLRYEGSKEYDEARRAFSSQQRSAEGSASTEVHGSRRTNSVSTSQSQYEEFSQLFPPSVFPNIGEENDANEDDLPNPPSLDGSSDSPPLVISSRGDSVPPNVVYGKAVGGYVLDDETKVLAVATKVVEDRECDGIYRPQAYYYEETDRGSLIMSNKRRHRCIVVVCCLVMFVGIFSIIMALVVQSTMGPNVNASQMVTSAPTDSPSTSAEAIFMNEMSAIVGGGVFEGNSYLGRAANWMMNGDPKGLGPFDPTFLQRFILVVIYFSTTSTMTGSWQTCNPPGTDEDAGCNFGVLVRQEDDSLGYQYQQSFRWLSAESECVWAGVTCDEGRVNSISLAGQNMTGTLPAEIAFLPFLQSLSLHYNEFTGSIPVKYARMRYLVNLDLHGNQLSGSIPNDLYENVILEQLNIGENQFTGTISSLVGQLTSLKGLHVDNNKLEGSIPTEIGKLRFLMYTRWNDNRFVGSIPTAIDQLTSLLELWLQRNALTGNIPSQIATLQGLEDLQLFENRLNGTIPEELYSMLHLRRLELSSNDLTGTISTSLGQLVRLTDLRVAKNALAGTIPSQLSSLSKLRIVWLHMNQLEGDVPQTICNIMGEGHLEYLNADCGPQGNPANPCDCCTGCCDRSTEICLLTNFVISN